MDNKKDGGCGCGGTKQQVKDAVHDVQKQAAHVKNVVKETVTQAADIAKETVQHAKDAIEERKK